jgi:hypothetical protein
MIPSEPRPKPAEQVDTSFIVEEMAAIPYEPLLPVEKKLIAWSLVLGFTLLGLLYWLSNTFFPTTAG